jgi:hypothetical protein
MRGSSRRPQIRMTRGGAGGRMHPAAAAGRASGGLRLPATGMPSPQAPYAEGAPAQGPVPGTPSDLPGGSEGAGEMGTMRGLMMPNVA